MFPYVFPYDTCNKCQAAKWQMCDSDPGDGRLLKVSFTKSKVTTMLIAYFDSRDLIHHVVAVHGQNKTGSWVILRKGT